MSDTIAKIAIFQKKEVRKQLHGGEWWFVISDVVAALTDSSDPARYIRDLRYRDESIRELFEQGDFKGASQISTPLDLKFNTSGGKQKFKCWNTEGIFRLIQSTPSKKAEPFKRWLAHVGYERIQEIENPELAQKRMKMLYKLKGYEDDWIERRTQGMAVRQDLTEEWVRRGINGELDYAILTAEISKATFGVTPSQYKKLKGLKQQNLRDHMTMLELLFTQLGEAATTEIARTDDAQGMVANKYAAKRGGSVAGNARKQLEKETGNKVVAAKNYLTQQHNKELE